MFYLLFKKIKIEVKGLEPLYIHIKNGCLTTWLYFNINVAEIGFEPMTFKL